MRSARRRTAISPAPSSRRTGTRFKATVSPKRRESRRARVIQQWTITPAAHSRRTRPATVTVSPTPLAGRMSSAIHFLWVTTRTSSADTSKT
ncbi:MAG: hypothetical protein DME07_16335 [Candidatus Rokuibacteriota bacterium]|nr:MAG: hypothetical protein DME07_16335 [Candidatus Rokubacteria bacterium]PYN58332.1 MAG: hypothetical protein DMD94_01120 [Candidatus Rokubacteria bacterium]